MKSQETQEYSTLETSLSRKERGYSPKRSLTMDDIPTPSNSLNYFLHGCLNIEAAIQLKRFTNVSFSRLVQIARNVSTNEALSEKLSVVYVRVASPELITLGENGSISVVTGIKSRMTQLHQLYLSKWTTTWEKDIMAQNLFATLVKSKPIERKKRKFDDDTDVGKLLEQRVKERGIKQMEEMKKITNNDNRVKERLATEELVACADSLRLAARGVMLRKDRSKRTNLSLLTTSFQKTMRTTLKLEEVISVIQNTKVHAENKENTRKYARNVLEKLLVSVPEWIRIVKKKNNIPTCSSTIDSTIIISEQECSFQNVRAKLGGRIFAETPQAESDQSDAIKLQQPTPSKLESEPVSSNNLDQNHTQKRMSWMENIPPLQRQQPGPSVLQSRSRLSLSKNRMEATNIIPGPLSQIESSTITTGKDLSQSNKSDSNPLRVNYAQILTAEDYDGGQVIDSESTNPRDLQRMFARLNKGERI